MSTERQIAVAQGLVTQAYLLGDTPWGLQAAMLISCGTTRLKGQTDKTVARVINRLQERVDRLRNLQQLREQGL